MSDLQNLTPANTYKGLLQVGDYTNGVDSTVKAVLDGEGTTSALAIGTTKVGIGTTSPTQELDVNGDIVSTTLTTSGAVTAGSVSTSGAVTGGSLDVSGNVVADEYALDQTGSSSSAVAIHAPATNELAIRTNSTEALRIDSAGDVGIGTTTPSNSKLHVAGGHINLTDNYAIAWGGGIDRPAIVGDKPNNTLKFYPSSNPAMTIDSAGNVGIGTDSPLVNLDIDGTLLFSTNSTNSAWMLETGVDSLSIKEKIGNSFTSRVSFQDGGNVGIGIVSPSAPLEVASTTGGVIMPRMNTAQMNAISSPTDGEMIYNTTEHKFYGRANGAWTALH